jgi:hypothetical protein
MQRDLGTFRSLAFNNFFFFVAMLVAGAVQNGLPPWSAYPFMALMALPLLFPLSSDPLEKIPSERMALWPLERRHRIGLRLASIVLSPVAWIAVLCALKLGGIGPALVLVAAATVKTRIPATNFVRFIPMLPGRLGGLITGNLRGMLSVLDTWLAILVSAVATAYRLTAHHPDPEALPILAMLVALALSTQTQSLFGLDRGSGATLNRMLPLSFREILLAKDIAWLTILIVLTAPLSLLPALTSGLAALAIGHHGSVKLRLPQKRWRFAAGRVALGALQVFAGACLGFAEMRRGSVWFFGAALLYGVSLWFYGRAA